MQLLFWMRAAILTKAKQSSMVLHFQVPRSPLEKDSLPSYRSPSENIVHCNAK